MSEATEAVRAAIARDDAIPADHESRRWPLSSGFVPVHRDVLVALLAEMEL